MPMTATARMFSRDDFEHVLSPIVSAPRRSRVHIIAHSMGTMLALESLRQLYARYGDDHRQDRCRRCSPRLDIDIDVFSSAIGRIESARWQNNRRHLNERSRVGAVGAIRWRMTRSAPPRRPPSSGSGCG